ncbi:DUF4837 family protein [Aureibacter tunicatorum]|uniref:DUF4837 family protein n=1 Tax=Aureibacter tunicatorum TaxID=866807 RepID=A0AAE4BQM5_9BACT|nr:DUF4837 family protein [Aureibacter tunicatorum]MDR6237731.1 hypothetical protein [Aureibacter tunicatorum]BDD02766.1 hypothetical protein AUTU_02490 [Aureibacter tunicatorum]
MKNLLAFAFIFFALFSCGEKKQKENVEKEKKDKSSPKAIRPATGAVGEVVVVIDTTVEAGKVGEALKNALQRETPGIIRSEPEYKVHFIAPKQFNSVFKYSRNLIFVTTFDVDSEDSKELQKNFNDKAFNEMKSNPDYYKIIRYNQFAKGQVLLQLFGVNQADLAKNINKHAQQIRDILNQEELNRIQKEKKFQPQITNLLKEKYGFSLQVPYGYKVAKQSDSLIWFRENVSPKEDKNILVAYKPYVSKEQLSIDSIAAFRDEANRYVEGLDAKTFKVVQTGVPVETREVNFENRYALESRGAWKLSNNSMGGSFISYAFVDETRQRLYYLETFIYGPDKKLREDLREMEAILWTFKAD